MGGHPAFARLDEAAAAMRSDLVGLSEDGTVGPVVIGSVCLLPIASAALAFLTRRWAPRLAFAAWLLAMLTWFGVHAFPPPYRSGPALALPIFGLLALSWGFVAFAVVTAGFRPGRAEQRPGTSPAPPR
jgi:hypothetical protein